MNTEQLVETTHVNNPIWDGLGVRFNEPMDAETALQKAKLDWGVASEPIYTGEGTRIPGYLANSRDDNGTVLGIVGEGYKVLQNREAFEFMDSLVEEGGLQYESAFCIKGGRQVCLLGRLPSVDYTVPEDPSLRYIMAVTSHDGSKAINLVPTSVRVWCANMIRLATKRGAQMRISVSHKGDMESKLAQARQYLSLMDKAFVGHAENMKLLAERDYSISQAAKFFDTLFPKPEVETKRVMNNYEKIRTRLVQSRQSHSNDSIRGSWYELLSTITHYCDHSSQLRKSTDVSRAAESRFMTNFDGPNSQLKMNAINLALEMAL